MNIRGYRALYWALKDSMVEVHRLKSHFGDPWACRFPPCLAHIRILQEAKVEKEKKA